MSDPFSACGSDVDRILSRYFRIIKYTCLERSEHESFVYPLVRRLRNKHRCGFSRIQEHGCIYSEMNIWVEGNFYRHVDRAPLRRLRQLNKIAKKVEQLHHGMNEEKVKEIMG